jgi:hypothetical protein
MDAPNDADHDNGESSGPSGPISGWPRRERTGHSSLSLALEALANSESALVREKAVLAMKRLEGKVNDVLATKRLEGKVNDVLATKRLEGKVNDVLAMKRLEGKVNDVLPKLAFVRISFPTSSCLHCSAPLVTFYCALLQGCCAGRTSLQA